MTTKIRSLFMLSLLLLLAAAGAQAQGYKDVTSYIQNADQAASGGWAYTRQTTGGETKTWSAINKAYSGSYDSEIYAGDPLAYTTFSATQTITLPRGTYHLIGKAFKRDVPSVVLFAETGGQRSAVEVASVYWQFSSTTPTDKSPSTMDAAAKAFNGNMYLNDLAFTVETDEAEVTIGYAGEFTAARQWFIFGGMTLYQVQDEVSMTFPVDVTPSLNRSRESYTGLTGRYANANVYIHEKYSGSNFPVGDLVYQTFAGLENGIYEVVINANASKANGVGTLPSADPYVYAGGTSATVHAVEQSAVSTVGEYVLSRVTVTDGTLRVGLYNQAEGGNWALFNVKSVKYCGVDLTALVESYEELLATAKALKTQDKVMQQTVKTELDEAIDAAETDVNTDSREWLETIISRLSAAISRAQESSLLYEGDILLAVNGMKAQSTSDDVRAAVQARYDQRLYATEAEVYDYYQQQEMAALPKQPDTDYTSVIINPGFELGNTDGWTVKTKGDDTGVRSTASSLYAYSGTEGDYLFNTWAPRVTTLDVSQTVSGLPNGYYTVSAQVAGYGDASPIALTANRTMVTVRPTNTDVDAEVTNGHELLAEQVVVTDGTLTITVSNTGKGYTFFKADAFKLTLTGLYEPLDNYIDLAYEVNLENEAVSQFLSTAPYDEAAPSVIADYATDVAARYDQPRVASVDIPLHGTEATLTLTAAASYNATTSQTFTVPAGSVVYDLPNLLPQCTYYYKVEAEGETIASGTITTSGHLRMMKAEGIANMRDLGGWLTTDGLRLRYGKLYRGSELAAGKTYTATEADLAMLKALDVAAEIDLREDIDFAAGNMSASAIEGATYYYANLSRWGEDALNLDTERFKAAFHTMLTTLKAGHAAYFHCIFGADRTGCLAFLTEGLLGLPVDQLYKDYELTSFSTAGLREKAGIDHKLQYIRNLPGASLQEQFFNYWRGAVGISDADLLDFISIMIDGESAITTTPPQPLWSAVLPPTVPDGEYYLYLPTYGQFLGRGFNWGTRAACDNYGVPATIRTNGVGVTTIQYLDNGYYLGSDGYADKAAYYNTVSWHAEQHDGHLVLKSHNGLYLAMSDNGSLADGGSSTVSVVGGFAADISSATPIELKTAEEQKALVAATHHASTLAAFQAAGIDMADTDDPEAVLSAAGYTVIEHAAAISSATTGSTTDWVLSEPYAHGETDNYGNAYNVGDYGGELYQKNGSVSQTITVPWAGLYRLTLNALYRQGTNADCYAIGQRGYELSNAYVSIIEPSAPLGSPRQSAPLGLPERASTPAPLGSPGQAIYIAQIPSWYSDCLDSATPNTTAEAKALMEEGRYGVELYAYIGDSKQATITVHVPNFTPWGWCLFNNFALTTYVKDTVDNSGNLGIAYTTEKKYAPTYNAAGQRVTPEFKGLVIENGKKKIRK